MDNNTLIIVMLVLAFLGVLATVIYYVARYSFKTDYEKDQERAALEEKAATLKQAEELKEREPEKRPPPELEVVRREEALPPVEEPVREKDLSQALSKTKESFWGRIKGLWGTGAGLEEGELEALEEVLYTSDLGPQTVERLMESVQSKLERSDRSNPEKIREALRTEMQDIFSSQPETALTSTLESWLEKIGRHEGPYVILVVGVNGSGKTTTIGKLAHAFASRGQKTMVAAGDTFRAAAGAQLKVWSERAQVEIFSPEGVSDPSAVAFDACQKAKAKDFKVVIVDTAGRLHTQKNLMDELAKMRRVIQKVYPEAPHETLLVLDSNSGQNALMQARQFHEAIDVTGVVLTKLDGTAKGGVALGIVNELHLPIQFVGVGEGINDLRPFNPEEFVNSII